MNNEIIITNHNPQDITITQQDNQTIFVNGGGNVIGITDVKVNGNSVVSNNIAYVIVPTMTSELINNSGYLTSETDPTVPSYVKAISRADINNWNNKQDTLVSGTNIKTINNNSLLGSGNIDIQGGESYIAGTGINITNGIISNTITNYNDLTDLPSIPNKTSDLINDNNFVSEDELAEVSFTGSYNSLSDTPVIPDSTSDLTNDSGFIDSTTLNTALSTKQDTLVSGTNIKTINNNSLLGSGNINITGGSATDVQINGNSITSNNIANIFTESTYNPSTNKIATINDIAYKTEVIYSSNGDNATTLSLTKATTNFDYIEIIYSLGNAVGGQLASKVIAGNPIVLSGGRSGYFDNYYGIRYNSTTASFSGTTLSKPVGYTFSFKTDGSVIFSDTINDIYIHKVIGIKEV